jgi:hypothetical protein
MAIPERNGFMPARLPLNQFDQNHISLVAETGRKPQNSSVTTRAIREARSEIIEQLANHFCIGHARGRGAASVDFLNIGAVCAAAGERDQALSIATNGEGFGARGLDTLVLEQLINQRAAQSIALISGTS